MTSATGLFQNFPITILADCQQKNKWLKNIFLTQDKKTRAGGRRKSPARVNDRKRNTVFVYSVGGGIALLASSFFFDQIIARITKNADAT